MTLLPTSDLPVATSIAVFFQFFGGAINIAIAENLFVTKLISSLHTYAPSLDAETVVAAGAEGLRRVVAFEGGDELVLGNALVAYDKAIMETFFLCVAGGALSFLASFGMEWRNLAKKPEAEEVVVEEK